MSPLIHDMIEKIEACLASSYSFSPATSAVAHLLDEQAASPFTPVADHRAAVLLRYSPAQDELDIGVYVHSSLTEQLVRMDPFEQLQNSNLDAFCAIVEEISHFHLVINRAQMQRSVSRLELEWQGEIDKVLLASYLLLEQTGSPCFRQLVHIIFDRSMCYVQGGKVYEEAHHYAARCWYQLLPQLKGLEGRAQWLSASQELRRTYSLDWTAKLDAIRRR